MIENKHKTFSTIMECLYNLLPGASDLYEDPICGYRAHYPTSSTKSPRNEMKKNNPVKP